jgi:hypothetical protein
VALCAPVNKDGSGISDPDTHLVCYNTAPKGPPLREFVRVDNQLVTQTLEVLKPQTLCVPSSKTPVDPGEPCGPVVCGPFQLCCNPLQGICVSPGDVCIQK